LRGLQSLTRWQRSWVRSLVGVYFAALLDRWNILGVLFNLVISFLFDICSYSHWQGAKILGISGCLFAL
jgi:hypothetical protein